MAVLSKSIMRSVASPMDASFPPSLVAGSKAVSIWGFQAVSSAAQLGSNVKCDQYLAKTDFFAKHPRILHKPMFLREQECLKGGTDAQTTQRSKGWLSYTVVFAQIWLKC